MKTEKEKLIDAQKEYIKFLDKYISGVSMYLHVHGQIQNDKDVKKGKLMRDKISELEKSINPQNEPAGHRRLEDNKVQKKPCPHPGIMCFDTMKPVKCWKCDKLLSKKGD